MTVSKELTKYLTYDVNSLLHRAQHVLYSFTAPKYAPPQLICVMELALVKERLQIARCRYVQLGVALGRIQKYEWCEQQANKKQVTA